MPKDYDGDGETDVAVYQQSTGNWFIVGSTSGFFQVLNFGGAGFIPVPGDYDGDGKTDVAVYQQSTGNWFVVGTTSGIFHTSIELLVERDSSRYRETMTGTGETDVAVYQSSKRQLVCGGNESRVFQSSTELWWEWFYSSTGRL